MSASQPLQPPQSKPPSFKHVIPLDRISDKEDTIDPRETSIKYRGSTRAKFTKENIELIIPKFMIDDHYVGVPPNVQVSINNLNDNIDGNFLRKELNKFGNMSQCEIIHHPISKQHLGLAKVQFDKVTAAKECVLTIDGKSFMGKKISVFLDPRYTKINAIKENLINPPTQVTAPAHQALIPPTIINNIQFPSITQPTNGIYKEQQNMSLDERINFLLSNNSGLAQCLMPNYNEKHINYHPDYNKLINHNRTPSPIDNLVAPFNNEFRKDTYNRNERNNHNSWSNHRDSNRDEYHNSHSKRRSPSPPRKQKDHHEENAVVKRDIPNNLTRAQIKEELSSFYNIFEKKCEDALWKHFHRKILEAIGYPLITSEQARYIQEKQNEADRRKREQIQRKPATLYKDYGMGVLAQNDGNRVYGKPRQYNFYFNRKANDSRINTSRGGRADENVREEIKRKNRSTGMVPTEHSKQTSKQDLVSISESGLTSSFSTDTSSSDSDSDSESDSDSDSSSESSSDSSDDERSSLHKQEDILNYQESAVSLNHDTPTEANLLPLKAQSRSQEEAEVAQFLANLGTTVSTENSTVKGNDVEMKDDKIDYSDEDLIRKPTKKRKIIDDHFPTERQFKRIKALDQAKHSDIPDSTFEVRNEDEQNRIIDDIIGIDEEAYKFLMEAYDNMCDSSDYSSLLEDSSKGTDDVNRAHLPFILKKKKGKDKKDDAIDTSGWWKGCSRCDGFPRVKDGSKKMDKVWKGDTDDKEDLSKAPIKSRAHVKSSSRSDLRGEQRRFAVAHAETLGSAVMKFMSSSLAMRSKNLRFSLSKIHKWGLFACERIANGAAVIEYVGEKIRPSLADHREKVYANSETHDGSSYFFRVDDQVIDATLKGNKARFINHSCNPNCIAKVIRHDNGMGNAIVIYASKTIEEEEEITYDYKFPREDVAESDKIRCNCRASNCQKYLN